MSFPRRRWAAAVMIALATVASTNPVAAVSPAGSIARVPPGDADLVVSVPLTVDCASAPQTSEAIQFMSRYKLCGYGDTRAAAGVTPETIVYGNCGTLSLYTYNSGGGWMQWKGEITSSLGPFVAAGYTGDWRNNDTSRQGGVSRSYVGLTSDWLDIFPILTGPGHVYSKITYAWDRLFWGLLCTNAGVPWSWTVVTG